MKEERRGEEGEGRKKGSGVEEGGKKWKEGRG